jgi:hypothetical protein
MKGNERMRDFIFEIHVTIFILTTDSLSICKITYIENLTQNMSRIMTHIFFKNVLDAT